MAELLEVTNAGLYCAAGGFHIDPWSPVDRAVITHAHSDHARAGCKQYLAAAPGEGLLRLRLGENMTLDAVAYGERRNVNGVNVSLHPAGHVLGSAQVLVEHEGQRVVVTGDYKLESDSTCDDFEPVACDTFISESTFGLPIYRWPSSQKVFAQINTWWQSNVEAKRTSIAFVYALGKAQRLLSGLDETIGPILLHGAVDSVTQVYREVGITLPETQKADVDTAKQTRGRAIVLAPLSANGTTWCRKFTPISTAFASGWMAVRGARRIRSVDRGFVLSDHVDWHGLMRAIDLSGAQRIGLTHGYAETVARYLNERGRNAFVVPGRYASGRRVEEED